MISDLGKKAMLAMVSAAAVGLMLWASSYMTNHFTDFSLIKSDVLHHHETLKTFEQAAAQISAIETALMHQTGRVAVRDFGVGLQMQLNRHGRAALFGMHDRAILVELDSGQLREIVVNLTGVFSDPDQGLLGVINVAVANELGLNFQENIIRAQIRPYERAH